MKLFISNIKNFEETETPKKNYLYFRKRKLLIFQEMELFSLPRKVSYTSGNRNPKKPLIFSQKKLFLYFGKRKPRKTFLYFLKKSFSYISGNGNPEKIIYISEN